MAIETPEAIRLANEDVRPLADLVAGAFQSLDVFVKKFDGKSFGQLFPDDTKQIIADGSDTDGRTPISGADVHVLYELAKALTQESIGEISKRMPTVLKIAVNPRSLR